MGWLDGSGDVAIEDGLIGTPWTNGRKWSNSVHSLELISLFKLDYKLHNNGKCGLMII